MTRGLVLSAIDRSASPTEDFERFALGSWHARVVVPADKPAAGLWDEVGERSLAYQHAILEALSSDRKAAGDDRKLAALYATGMDTAAIQRDRLDPIAPELARIDAVRSRRQLVQVLASLHKERINAGWALAVGSDDRNAERATVQLSQAGLGLPDRDYYLRSDRASVALRRSYRAHVAALFRHLGDSRPAAQAHAEVILALETRLARASRTLVEQRDPKASYNPFTLSQLAARIPGIPFDTYFRAIDLPDPGVILVREPAYLRAVGSLLGTVPLSDWKTYLRWHTINAAAPYLHSAVEDEDFDFNQKTLQGTPRQSARWKRVLATCDQLMGEALGRRYVAVAFPSRSKTKAREIIDTVLSVLKERLATLDWMSEATRRQALEKVGAMRVKVGYPDRWRSYSALTVSRSSSYWGNVRAGRLFDSERLLRRVGKPMDRDEWPTAAYSVDAFYNPHTNDIVLPAGILQPGFFDPDADDAVNFGAIGFVVGHEITHGFDDQGRLYDERGNLRDWWTPQDSRAYEDRASQVVRQYDAYALADGTRVVGKQTLGENLADIGGLKLAWLAYQRTRQGKPAPERIDGFTDEQRFFLAYAQLWRIHMRPEAEKLWTQTSLHSPPRFRLIGPVVNQPAFFSAWSAPNWPQSGAATRPNVMSRAPIPTASIW